jgi:nucleotide-binding universal stress UspA family protein
MKGYFKWVERRLPMLAQKEKDRFKILLADDGSQHAEAAGRLVADLPFPSGSEVIVLRAFASTQAGDLAPLEKGLNKTCARLNEKGLQAKAELLLGSPAEKVVEYAEKYSPDLIVVGARGLRATLGILLGGVAQQVVEYACCPVLVVRAPYTSLARLLLVTDGSPSSQQAVKYLAGLPLPEAVKVQVMHVLPPPPIHMVLENTSFGAKQVTTPEQMMEMEMVLRAKEERDAKVVLDDIVQSLQSHGLAASSVLKRGDAASEIIAHAKENKIDLIVSGSRGLNQIRSWLMGSVSRKLVHYSGCSVLVVRLQSQG